MKIIAIDTFILKVPLGANRFFSSQSSFGERKSMLVRITTSEGIIGWGEGGQYGPAEPVASTILAVLAPLLLGQDPCQPEVLWEHMYTLVRDFGQKGTTIEAISAVDIALWDIFGKAQNLSIAAMMGGAFRTSIKRYATGLYYRNRDAVPMLATELPSVRVEAASYAEAGFPAIKMKIGLLSPKEDLQRIAAVRDVIGDDILLMVDANHAYRAPIAAQLAREMEHFNVFWFEEPVVPEDFAGYQQVKAATHIAIAGGECEYTRYGFARWITEHALDIVQPDLCCAGGLSEVRKIATLASACHVQCLPHVWGSGIAVAAGLQFLATLPPTPHTMNPLAPYNEPLVEWDANLNPLRTDLLTEPFNVEDNALVVPQGPGLGVTVDKTMLKRFLVDHQRREHGAKTEAAAL